MTKLITRRSVVRGGLALTALGTVASPAVVRSALGQSQIEIGNVLSISGPLANVTKQINDGTQTGVEVFSTGDIQFKNVVLDDQGDAGRAVRLVREAVESGRQKFFVNGTLSSTQIAIAKELNGPKGVFCNTSGADETTGKSCNRASFRWNSTTYAVTSLAVKTMVGLKPNAKRWYTVTAQYVFGENMLANVKRALAANGIEHVGNTFHSLTEREFSGYFPSILGAKPDVLFIANFGNQTTDFIRQAISFGLKQRMTIVVGWGTGLDQFQALGNDIIQDIYFVTPFWHVGDAPVNQEFVSIWQKRTGSMPNYLEASGYFAVKVLADGIRKANSTDITQVIQALEGMNFQGPSGDEPIRKEDHQVIKDAYMLLGKSREAMKDAFDFADVIGRGREYIPVAESGCKMS